MLATLATFLVKVGLGSIIDKTVDLMKHKASLENDKEKLKTEIAIEHIKAISEEARLMTDFNKSKLGFPWFWLFVGIFVLPLGAWWSAIILDSIFLFSWNIATVPILEEWGGQIIQWLFYVGGGIAAWKSIVK
ncbi:MAG: hypothetical protein ACRCXK_00405 [Wohlfahrtiimonas sp.]